TDLPESYAAALVGANLQKPRSKRSAIGKSIIPSSYRRVLAGSIAMWSQLQDMVSFSFLDVRYGPYLPSEAYKLWLRNAFRDDDQPLPCYHMGTADEPRPGAYASAIPDQHPTPLRSDELMRVVGERMQPEFVRLWLCKPESGLTRTHAETEAAALL